MEPWTNYGIPRSRGRRRRYGTWMSEEPGLLPLGQDVETVRSVSRDRSRGRGYSRGRNRGRSRRGPNTNKIGVTEMRELLEAHSMEILLQLCNTDNGFWDAIQEDDTGENEERTWLLLMLIGKALENPVLPHSTVTLLKTISESHWFETLPSLFGKTDLSISTMQQYLSCAFILMKQLLFNLSDYQTIRPLFVESVECIKSHRKLHTLVAKDTSLVGNINVVLKNISDGKQMAMSSPNKTINAVQNFCKVSVIPTKDDISRKNRPKLSPIKAHGAYKDLEEYLDVNFRLLRADFTEPLRKGIQGLVCEGQGQSLEQNANSDVHVFENVRIKGLVPLHNGVALCLVFDAFSLQTKRREWNREFIYGSLVCLMCDNQCYFGTVANTTKVSKGELQVSLEAETNVFINHDQNDRFLMVESQQLFEAYRHVLASLQIHFFYMSKYIFNCDMSSKAPGYLKPDTQYCFRDVDRNLYRAPVLSKKLWPSKSALGLNSAQYEAFQLALTHELAVIQGPPGTGKTYLGLKIAEVLFENLRSGRLDSHVCHKPMMVVCYTNHALDQFLEGIHDTIEHVNILRVGGRSQSQKLISCTMKEKKRKYLKSKRSRRDLFSKIMHGKRAKLEQHGSEIASYNEMLLLIQHNILKLEVLKSVIDDNHYKQLHASSNPQKTVVEWLVPGYCEMQLQDQPTDTTDDCQPNQEKVLDATNNRATLGEDQQIEVSDLLEYELQDEIRQAAHERAYEKVCTVGETGNIDDWLQTKAQRKEMMKVLKHQLSRTDSMTYAEVCTLSDVLKLEVGQRWRLYRYWLTEYLKLERIHILQLVGKYEELAKELNEMRQLTDLEVMRTVDVIGMTTTGAARLQSLIQALGPAILIIEEAAEIMEAHTVTALNPKCEHVILIGDHQQLRPKPAEYELERDFNLDLSMFERLVNNGIACTSLATQHRMRPEIARLLQPIYPHLENHESVTQYPDVQGIKHNMYFIDHKQYENFTSKSSTHTQSKSNTHEAEYLKSLVCYLIKQGYEREQITVLTLYNGQLELLKRFIKDTFFRGVIVSTVDNYQGEENDIVVLSLVRSNKAGKIGFLGVNNRICVALSRAKLGLFVIGNFQMLSNHGMWSKVLEQVGAQFGPSLPLYCQNHPDAPGIDAQSTEDFQKAPEGGCLLPCKFTMKCGHVCQLRCHPYDSKHKEVKCGLRCVKMCPNGHQCRKKCSEPCRGCTELVDKLRHCGHTIKTMCHKDADEQECHVPYMYEMPGCGHCCPGTCSQEPHECSIMVKMKMQCGHDVAVGCYIYHTNPPDKCLETVSVTLPCGHKATSECHVPASNIRCIQPIKVKRPCGHVYDGLCHAKPPRCSVFVEKRSCGHVANTQCYRVQGEQCKETTMKLLSCGHKAAAECHISTDTIFCKQKVDHTLACGHISTGSCSKKPSICRQVVEKQSPCGHVSIECHASPKGKCDRQIIHKLACGHKIKGPCSEAPVKCTTQVEKTRTCGHTIQVACHVTRVAQCDVLTKKSMSCGHTMTVKCYIKLDHNTCQEPVRYKLGCGHSVLSTCSNKTSICNKLVMKKRSCGHVVKMACQSMTLGECKELVLHKMDCGHAMRGVCSKVPMKCTELVEKERTCGHKIQIACHVTRAVEPCSEVTAKRLQCGHTAQVECNIDSALVQCRKWGTRRLSCGHAYTGPCYNSHKCRESRTRQLSCGHMYTGPCYNTTPPCMERVSLKCVCGRMEQTSCLLRKIHRGNCERCYLIPTQTPTQCTSS